MTLQGVPKTAVTMNSMLHAYAEARQPEKAAVLLSGITATGGVVMAESINSIIAAHCNTGHTGKALVWLQKMQPM